MMTWTMIQLLVSLSLICFTMTCSQQNCFADPCTSPGPCQNGGTCMALVQGSHVGYTCLCGPLTSGRNCEIRRDKIDEPCSSDADCGSTANVVCFKGTCLCQPGYYLSESRQNGTCLATCQVLASSFTAYQDSGITRNNLIELKNIATTDECKTRCLQYSNSECRSFDRSDQRGDCNPQSVTALTAPSYSWNYDEFEPGWFYYQRNCL